MRKIRFLSFVLFAFTLATFLPLFASCAGAAGEIVTSKKTVEVDLSGFAVVYEKSATNTTTLPELATKLASRISVLTGNVIKPSEMKNTKTTSEDKEILIGLTSRKESEKAHKSIKGDGFCIQVSDNKIVIVGSDVLFTVQALQYFINYCVGDEVTSGTPSLPAKVTLNKAKLVTLATNEGTDYTFVYSKDLNATRLHADPDFQGIYASCDNRDYPVVATSNIVSKIADLTGLRDKDLKDKTDAKEAEGPEMMLGILNREASTSVLNTLDGDEFIFCVKEGQYILTAWNDAGLVEAYDAIMDLFSLATKTTEDGKVTIAFPEGFEISGSAFEDWVMDFTRPQGEGISLYNTMDTSNGCLQFLYTGEGVSAEAFRTYCSTLKSEGYRVITENSIEGSEFATLVHDAKKIMLYVAYNAYSHQEEYGHEYKECLRIVSASTDRVTVPAPEILAPNTSYKKVTNSAVTAIAVPEGAVGLAYVVTLEDGSFVVFDGGASGPALLWNVLTSLHERISGKPTSRENPVHISAWVITHSHGDHYAVANSIISTRTASGLMKMDYLIGNYPSGTSIFPILNGDIMTMSGTLISSLAGADQSSFKFLKVHTGQKYYFANLEIEVMMTYDDHNPFRINNQNDTNTVLRFSLSAKDNPGAAPYTQLWLGDANKQQSRFMCTMYGDYLKSDMVQVAHHGNIGCENDLYDTVNAETVFFPNTLYAFNVYMTSGRSWWVNDVDQHLVFENPNTDYVFVSANAHTTIPFDNAGKPNYDGIFDAIDGTPIEYTTSVIPGDAAIKVPPVPGEES